MSILKKIWFVTSVLLQVIIFIPVLIVAAFVVLIQVIVSGKVGK